MMSNFFKERREFKTPEAVNYIVQGAGPPVLLIHGLAASLHDWDYLLPSLAGAGYRGYALDLLGHGEGPKPPQRKYQMAWLFDHLQSWVNSLQLAEPAVMIGHSLGGYLTLEYASRFPASVRGLVLVDPFYSPTQLPGYLRFFYRFPVLDGFIVGHTPGWLFRIFIDINSLAMGHSAGTSHALTDEVRARSVQDYARTAPGVYNLPNTGPDLTPGLGRILTPSLVVWGERDQTLAPVSFSRLVKSLGRARGEHIPAGHVPHQSNPDWFNARVLEFIRSLKRPE